MPTEAAMYKIPSTKFVYSGIEYSSDVPTSLKLIPGSPTLITSVLLAIKDRSAGHSSACSAAVQDGAAAAAHVPQKRCLL